MSSTILTKIKTELKLLKRFIHHRLYASGKTRREIVDNFHKLYYGPGDASGDMPWQNTRWMGIKLFKCPLDLWVYQEILFEVKPDLIVECGTADGGSTLYLANLCDIMDKGEIISIDIKERPQIPKHPRISYLFGSSTSSDIVEKIKNKVSGYEKILVILDSDHSRDHVLKELEIYSPIVSIGSYIIVEDSNVNGHPVVSDFGPGPMEAIFDFMKIVNNFAIDYSREKFLLTQNPNGYLKKVK
ncbi:MAG: CmcI family methyltransferase [bacterium]|nr:CmcI family methyltransferase [bacterium]